MVESHKAAYSAFCLAQRCSLSLTLLVLSACESSSFFSPQSLVTKKLVEEALSLTSSPLASVADQSTAQSTLIHTVSKVQFTVPNHFLIPGDTIELSWKASSVDTLESLKLQVTYDGTNWITDQVLQVTSSEATFTVPVGAPSSHRAKLRVLATNINQKEEAAETLPFKVLGALSKVAGHYAPIGAREGVVGENRLASPGGARKIGNYLYIGDKGGIWRMDLTESQPSLTLYAGHPSITGLVNGVGTAARFNYVQDIVSDGTYLYVAELLNHTIRKIEISTATVTTLAGTGSTGSVNDTGTAASFDSPQFLALDGSGNLYVSDVTKSLIRKIVLSTAVVTTVAGNGNGYIDAVGTAAKFYRVRGIAFNSDYSVLFVAESSNAMLRAIEISTAQVYTVAGKEWAHGHDTGSGSVASFNSPYGLTRSGNYLYVAAENSNVIRKVDISNFTTGNPTNVTVSNWVGDYQSFGFVDGSAANARFGYLQCATTDDTYLYICDNSNRAIRRVLLSDGSVTTLVGNTASLADYWSLAGGVPIMQSVFADSSYVYFGDISSTVRKYNISTGAVTHFAGSLGNTYTAGTTNKLTRPSVIVKHPVQVNGKDVFFFASTWARAIYRGDVEADGSVTITLIAGGEGNIGTNTTAGTQASTTASGTSLRFGRVEGLAIVSVSGTYYLYVADYYYNNIRKISLASLDSSPTYTGSVIGIATTTASNVDGSITAARFRNPYDLATDGTSVFVADFGGNRIRKIDPASSDAVSTVVGSTGTTSASAATDTDGTGTSATVNAPRGLTADSTYLYFTTSGKKLRRYTISDGTVTTLAGDGTQAIADGMGTSASLYLADFISIVGTKIYIADQAALRSYDTTTGLVKTLFGTVQRRGNPIYHYSNASFSRRITIDDVTTLNGVTYVADGSANVIWRINGGGTAEVYAGSLGEPGTARGDRLTARFLKPLGIVSDGVSKLYVAESGGHIITEIDVNSGSVTTLAGLAGTSGSTDATGTSARFYAPVSLAYAAGSLYINDSLNYLIRKLVVATQAVTVVAGTGSSGNADGIGTAASLNTIGAMAIPVDGNLYFTQTGSGSYTIRKINVATLEVSTPYGTAGTQGTTDGVGTAINFYVPSGLTADDKYLWVSDTTTHSIRRINTLTGRSQTVVGGGFFSGNIDGPLSRALTYNPLTLSNSGSEIFINDTSSLSKLY